MLISISNSFLCLLPSLSFPLSPSKVQPSLNKKAPYFLWSLSWNRLTVTSFSNPHLYYISTASDQFNTSRVMCDTRIYHCHGVSAQGDNAVGTHSDQKAERRRDIQILFWVITSLEDNLKEYCLQLYDCHLLEPIKQIWGNFMVM